jgi:hypothetical protein
MAHDESAGAGDRFSVDSGYVFTAILSWLLPGAGHWLLGYRVRAVVIGATLLGLFWTGEVLLAKNMAVTWEVHPVFFCLQAGNGFSALLADGLWGEPLYPNEGSDSKIRYDLPVHLNLGILFASISGLLNLLVVLHVLDPRVWKEAADDARARREARARPGAEASPR